LTWTESESGGGRLGELAGIGTTPEKAANKSMSRFFRRKPANKSMGGFTTPHPTGPKGQGG
jgi:hypothetical protein